MKALSMNVIPFRNMRDHPVRTVILLLLVLAQAACAYGGLTLFDRLTERRVAAGCAYRLSLTSGGDSVTLRCMLDTGLHLLESFSGAPVILADRAACQLGNE